MARWGRQPWADAVGRDGQGCGVCTPAVKATPPLAFARAQRITPARWRRTAPRLTPQAVTDGRRSAYETVSHAVERRACATHPGDAVNDGELF